MNGAQRAALAALLTLGFAPEASATDFLTKLKQQLDKAAKQPAKPGKADPASPSAGSTTTTPSASNVAPPAVATPATAPASSAAVPASSFDVQGVRLGMTPDEVLEVVRARKEYRVQEIRAPFGRRKRPRPSEPAPPLPPIEHVLATAEPKAGFGPNPEVLDVHFNPEAGDQRVVFVQYRRIADPSEAWGPVRATFESRLGAPGAIDGKPLATLHERLGWQPGGLARDRERCSTLPLPPSWRAPAGGTGYEDRLARCGPTEVVVSAVLNIHHGAYQAYDVVLASPLAIVEADRRLRSAAESGIQ